MGQKINMQNEPDSSSSRALKVNFIVWLLLVLFTVLIVVTISWLPAFQLSRSTSSTTGYVIKKYPKNHQYVGYQYTVNGENYKGKSIPKFIGESFESIKIGDDVKVWYDDKYPNNSTTNLPVNSVVGATGDLVAVAVIVPFILMLILHHNKRLPYLPIFDIENQKNRKNNPKLIKGSLLRTISIYILFILVDSVWLGTGFISYKLKYYVEQLYSGTTIKPFATTNIWLFTPFLVFFIILIWQIYYIKESNKRSNQKKLNSLFIFMLFILAFIYLILTFIPFNIIMGDVN
jgi:hypothetical protein